MQQQEVTHTAKEMKNSISVNLDDQLFVASLMERLGVHSTLKGKLNVLADTKAVAEVNSS